ncbi:MAG TPA: bifunctional glycosyltransferase family 2/GtrA family protein [Trebonia sp.]|jgi:putative flippase GtrA|nr:bifunctional glycosyltransferase family 2/GtrA family protein [Trebonia sp.]
MSDASPQVEIVIPVRNEERDLAPSVRRLVGYLRSAFPCTARVTIADNGSTDGTWAVAQSLATALPGEVGAVHLDLPGRGRALHAIWSASDAEVLAYMDVDLSTDLNALLPLVAPLLSGHSDVAIGTRLARGSRVVRGAKREVISRGYNLLLRATLGVGFSDAQCGFKAIRADAARELLPLVEDRSWFFDTELLVLAERAGLRIHEVPVDWIDDADSRVDIVATALGDLRGVRRVGWGLARGRLKVPVLRERGLSGAPGGAARGLAWQLPRFLAIGVLSTAAYVLLYLLFRGFAGAQAANLAALLLTAVGNTAANRRLTFGVRGRAGVARHQFRGLIAFAAGLLLTSGALAMLHAASPSPGRGTEVVVLVAANLAATLVRFALYRNWVFGAPRGGGAPPETSPPKTALPAAALPEIALPEIALPEITPADVVNETTWSTR